MTDSPEDQPKKPTRRKRRFGFWMINGVLIFAGLVFIFGMSISGRNLNAPRWVSDRVVSRINANLNAGHVTLGRLQFQIDNKGIPKMFLGDLGVFDSKGAEIVRLNDVGARFSISALYEGDIKPETISLSGAQMTLRRRVDGQFDISFGGGSATSGTFADVLDQLDLALQADALSEIRMLGAEDLTITVEDARSGRLWQVTEGALQLKRLETGLDLSIAFDVFNGSEELAETIVGIQTNFADSSVVIGASFKNTASGDIALQSPALSFLEILDAPISGALRVEIDEQGSVSSISGALEIAPGTLRTGADIQSVGFESAKAYFEFDPSVQKIVFSEVSFVSEVASAVLSGQAYLRDLENGWPSSLIGQFALSDLRAFPRDILENEVTFSQGAIDFRLQLNPLSIEVGQLVLQEGDEKLVANGTLSAHSAGWQAAADLTLNHISSAGLLSLWPLSFSPNTRNWVVEHITSAQFTNVQAALRFSPGKPVRRSVNWDFQDTTVRYINTQPEIMSASGYGSIDGDDFTLVIEKGSVIPAKGGSISIRDSVVKIPDITENPAPILIRLAGKATNTATLSLLNEAPFTVLRNASFGPEVSNGLVDFTTEVEFALKRNISLEDVKYLANATLLNTTSTKLMPGRLLSADRLKLTADNDGVEIAGPLGLGDVASDMIWRQETKKPGRSEVSGSVELSQAFVSEFGIGLPARSVSGAGLGQFHIALERGTAPKFTLKSDLNRVGLRIAQIGWNKSKNATGALNVSGTLGDIPIIEALDISGGGLNASGGQVTLAADGSMQTATFSRVRVGGWLDAPIILRGRGAGVVPSVQIDGGTIDIRKTAFAGADSQTGGAGGPISLNMDQVIVSEGITLTNFIGDFDSAGGLTGNFTAQVNGKTPLTGRLAPGANGTAIRIQSDNAGAVLRNAGVVEYANTGQMDLRLLPRPENGGYDGQMLIKNTKVNNAPGMADLLSAISIVGLLDQLSGNGIHFDNVEASFRLSPTSVNLTQSSAVGPSLGISLNGVYDLTTSTMNMQGVVSPVYFLNGIGQIFSRRGEGLFGFNFNLKGTSDDPNVSVNPLSILTPGMFRDIFRAPPPQPNQ